MAATISVELAQHADVGAIAALLGAMHQEGDYRSLPFDSHRVTTFISDCLDAPERYRVYLARRDGEIIGVIAGYLTDYLFCDAEQVCDLVFYVSRQHRRSNAARRLETALREWARELGVYEMCLSVSTAVQHQRIGAFYQRLGYRHVGGIFKYTFAAPEQRG